MVIYLLFILYNNISNIIKFIKSIIDDIYIFHYSNTSSLKNINKFISYINSFFKWRRIT